MRILALDPGKVNFAFAVMENKKVLEAGYIPCIQELKRDLFEAEAKGFRDRYFALLLKYEPDIVVAERFMARPRSNGGVVGEYINIMLGIVYTVNSSKDIPTELITAASWKNYLNGRYGRVETLKDHFPHLSVHEADSLGIAVYTMENQLNMRGKLLKQVRRLRRYPFAGRVPKKVKTRKSVTRKRKKR